MWRIPDLPSGLRHSEQRGVEIKLWEVYVIHHRGELRHTLASYALDRGPVALNGQEHSRVSYRFLNQDWETTIKPFLLRDAIPYEVTRTFNVRLRTAKPRVYVVEDDLDILFGMNVILENAGYDVTLSHRATPLMHLPPPDVDLFIVDKMMVDGDGLQICQRLRSRPETCNTPVIVISANRNCQHQAMQAGANEFLEKPFNTRDLLEVVSKYTRTNFRAG